MSIVISCIHILAIELLAFLNFLVFVAIYVKLTILISFPKDLSALLLEPFHFHSTKILVKYLLLPIKMMISLALLCFTLNVWIIVFFLYYWFLFYRTLINFLSFIPSKYLVLSYEEFILILLILVLFVLFFIMILLVFNGIDLFFFWWHRKQIFLLFMHHCRILIKKQVVRDSNHLPTLWEIVV